LSEDHTIEFSVKFAQGHCVRARTRFWGPGSRIATKKMKSRRDVVVMIDANKRNVVGANVVD
jgi:hypothetical protein